jgi:hypothetical protein
MSEVEIYQPRADLAVSGSAVIPEMDSWIAVCSDVIKVANVICDTPFVPDGLRGSGPAVAAAILAGRELSLGPMTSLANIHVIKGKPALSAVLMRALVQAQGHQWQDGDVTDTRAVVRGRRKGEAEWTEVTFTADQAKKAGIDLGKYPQDKLYARATSRLARRKFADVIAGMPYSAEELEDGPDAAAVEAPAAAENGHAPAQRTAQRRQRRQVAAERPVAAVPDEKPASGPAAATGPDLPPLPGEDEPEPDAIDKDAPGSVSKAQLTKLGAIFTDYGFKAAERQQRLTVASQITGRELESSADLSLNEARALIDTLESCGSRDNLVALMAASEQGGGPGPGGDPDGDGDG